MITAEQLVAAQARVDDATAARAERDELIRQALEGGWSQHAIARLLGITQARVAQIATAGA